MKNPAPTACAISRKELIRSIYEGIAFSHRNHLEKLLRTREEKPKTIRLAGEKYQLYKETIEALDPLWDSIQANRDKKRAD